MIPSFFLLYFETLAFDEREADIDVVDGSDREYQPSCENNETSGSETEDKQEDDEREKALGRAKRKRGGARKRKGKGNKRKRVGKGDDGDDGDGTGAQPGNPMPYWHPDCKRNGHQYVALQAMSEVQWTRKERVEMMKTGGLKGVVAYMGAGFGGDQWGATVDSWAFAVAEAGEVQSMPGEGITLPALLRRCSAAIKKGVASSFFSMVSYLQLFLKTMVSVFLYLSEVQYRS